MYVPCPPFSRAGCTGTALQPQHRARSSRSSCQSQGVQPAVALSFQELQLPKCPGRSLHTEKVVGSGWHPWWCRSARLGRRTPTQPTHPEDKLSVATHLSSLLLCAQGRAVLLPATLAGFYLSMIHSISPTPSHSVEVMQRLKSSGFTSLFVRLVVHLYRPLQIFPCGRHSCFS